MARKLSKWMLRFNLVMTFVWMSLLVPTLLWWKQSVLWVSVMSLYANVVGHWSAFQASRAEVTSEENGDGGSAPEGPSEGLSADRLRQVRRSLEEDRAQAKRLLPPQGDDPNEGEAGVAPVH